MSNLLRFLKFLSNRQLSNFKYFVWLCLFFISTHLFLNQFVLSQTLTRLINNGSAVYCIAVSPDGTKITVGGTSTIGQTWDINTGIVVQSFSGHSALINDIAYSPDGSYIATASADNTAKVWDPVTGSPLGTLNGHTAGIHSITFSPDNSKIATGSYDNTIIIWNAFTYLPIDTLIGHSNQVLCVRYTPDGTKIISSSMDNTIKVWNATNGNLISTITGLNSPYSFGISPDNTRIAVGGESYNVAIFDIATGTLLHTFATLSSSVQACPFSPDGANIASVQYDGSIKIWDTVGVNLKSMPGVANACGIKYTPDGSKVITGNLLTSTISIWTINGTGTPPSLLYYPLSGSVNHPINQVKLQWDTLFTEANKYEYQVASNSNFGSIIIDDSTSTKKDTVYVSGLAHNTTYWWRVRSNYGNFQSSWSAPDSFSTVSPLVAPTTLVYPGDLATGMQSTETLRWLPRIGTFQYRLLIDTVSSFISPVKDTITKDTFYVYSNIPLGKTVHWKVQAGTSPSDTTPFTTSRSFSASTPAPLLTASVSQGTVYGSCQITATPGGGNHLVVMILNFPFTTPNVGDIAPSVPLNPYTSGFDITGVDITTNKYIGVYEAVDGSNSIVKFKQIILNVGNVAPPAAPTVPVINDVSNTFDWTNNPSFAANSDYEYSLDTGLIWYTCTVKPQTGIFGTRPTTSVQVRVKVNAPGNGSGLPGLPLLSNVAYTTDPAPILNGSISAGTINGSSKVNITGSEPLYYYKVSSTTLPTPNYGDTSPGGCTLYTSNADISSVDPTANKYLGVYGIDLSNKVLSFKLFTINLSDVNNLAPVITPATASQGTSFGTTKVADISGPYAFSYKVSSVPFATPVLNSTLPGGETAYTIGSDISGVDSVTNKYLGIYEHNGSNITTFKQFILNGSEINSSVSTITLLAPAPAAHLKPGQLVWIKWQATNLLSTSIEYSIDNRSTWSTINPTFIMSSLTDSIQWAVPGTPSTQCFIKILESGNPSVFGETAAPFIIDNMNTPNPIFPINNAMSVKDSNTVLKWDTTGTNALRYHMAFYADTNSAPSWTDSTTLGQDSLMVPFYLSSHTTYFWKVRTGSGDGHFSGWSSWSKFTTKFDNPPILSFPSVGQEEVMIIDSVGWAVVSGATQYRFQIANNPSFTSPIVNNTIPGTTFTFSGLQAATEYFWRVRGETTPPDTTIYSPVRNFWTLSLPAPAVLNLPVIDAKMVDPNNVFMKWDTTGTYKHGPSMLAATKYHYEIDPTKFFGAPLASDSTVAKVDSIRYSGAGLTTDTKYFWRVRTGNGGNRGSWSMVDSFTTAIPVPTYVFPAPNATNVLKSDSIKWNSVPQATSYRLQVSSNSSFSSTVIDTVTFQTAFHNLNGLNYGQTYFWKVQSIRAPGDSSVMWQSQQFTMSSAPPNMPNKIFPAPNALMIPNNTGMKWDTVGSTAVRFEYQADTSITFSSPMLIFDSTFIKTDSAYFLSPLIDGGRYFWRIRAVGTGNAYSAWSAVDQFKVRMVAPSIILPANNAQNIDPSQPIIVTHAGPVYPLGYRFFISDTNNFMHSVKDTFVTTITSSAAYPLSGINPYPVNKWLYLKVKSEESGNDTSDWTGVIQFKTANAPLPPIKLFPPPDGKMLSTILKAKWDTVGTSGMNFYLEIDTNKTFASPGYHTGSANNTTDSLDLTAWLVSGTKYFWRMRSQDGAATYSQWSTIDSFKTTALAPNIIFPTNGALNIAKTDSLHWGGNAPYYRVQISNDPSFNSTFKDTLTNKSSYHLSGFPGYSFNAMFYWRVIGIYAIQDSTYWSNSYSFNTLPAVPPAPTFIYPPTNYMIPEDYYPTVTLWWNAMGPQDTVHVQAATDPGFTQLVGTGTYQTLSAFVFADGFVGGSKYYWRARASNPAGIGPWKVDSFYTKYKAPNKFLPPPNAIGVPVMVTFQWDTTQTWANKWYVQYDTTKAFNSPAGMLDSASGTSYSVLSPLLYGHKYFWRMRSSDGTLLGAWSKVDSFNTTFGPPSPPALFYPIGSNISTIGTMLRWDSVPNAQRYYIQVSDTTSFTNLILDDSTWHPLVQKPITGLQLHKPYWWRVRTANNDGMSSWAWNGFYTRQGAPSPVFPSNFAIDYAADTAAFGWNSTIADRYRVLFDTSTSFKSPMLKDTLVYDSLHLKINLQRGMRYFWKVQGIYSATDSSEWSQTWEFRTMPYIPSAPTLLSPSPNAKKQPVNIQLTWTKRQFAQQYSFEVSPILNFTSILFSGSVPDTFANVPNLMPGTKFYWRVRSGNAAGFSGFAVDSFTTEMVPPNLMYPNQNQVNVPLNDTLRWNPIGSPAYYRIQIIKDTTNLWGAVKFKDTIVFNTSYLYVSKMQPGTDHFWRVLVANSTDTSKWSQPFKFTTMVATLTKVDLMYPWKGAINIPINDTLKWNPLPGATKYVVEVASDSSISSIFIKDTSVYTNFRPISSMNYNVTHYWRVRGVGDTPGPWSDVWNFTTRISPPGTPTLINPPNFALNMPTFDTLIWAPAPGATSYTLQVALDSAFNNIFTQDGPYSTTSRGVGEFPYGQQVYWRVQAQNAGGISPWSQPWRFTTKPIPPPPPVLLGPPNFAQNTPVNDTLRWDFIQNADSYRLQLTTDSMFFNLMVDDSSLKTNRYPVNLVSNTTYYWRLKSKNGGGSSPWSMIWRFRTIPMTPTAPILVYPPDNYANVNNIDTLAWNPINGVISYRLQVSQDSVFGTLMLDDSNVTEPRRIVNNFQFNAKYFWRVSSRNPAGSSPWSPVWKFFTKPMPPAPVALLYPPNFANNISLGDTLRWTPQPNVEVYRLQVTTDSMFMNLMIDDSSLTTPNRFVGGMQNNMKYYWRVLGRNRGGNGPWSMIWTYSTRPFLPLTPILQYPPNMVQNISLNDTLRWSGDPYSRLFRIQVSTDSSFTNKFIDDSSLTIPSRFVGGMLFNTKYYWRVLSKNEAGISTWSLPWQFTTVQPPPAIPSLQYPPNFANNIQTNDSLKWFPVPNANFYRVQVSSDSMFSQIIVDDSNLTMNRRFVSIFVNGSQYFWRVSSRNNSGVSPWSQVWKFRTVPLLPPIPSQIYPFNMMANVQIYDTLRWTQHTNVDKYWVQVSKDSAFSNIILNDSSLISAGRFMGPLENSTSYFWRVAAMNSAGRSPWSNVWLFRTIQRIPIPPVLMYPPNFAFNIPLQDTLRWNPVPDAQVYRVQLSRDSAFFNLVFDDSSVTSPNRFTGQLNFVSQYFWRVRAKNSGGGSMWSQVNKFTTSPAIPQPPVLYYPPNNFASVQLYDTLAWSPMNNVENYRVQLSKDSIFANIMLDDSLVKIPKKLVGPLDYNSKYFWRVLSKNGGGSSQWSVIWRFGTIPALPQVPQLFYPPNNFVNVQTNDSLVWQYVNGADHYRLQISRDSLFANLFLDDSAIKQPKRYVSIFELNTKYFWRVQSINIAGKSPWSPVWKFGTVQPVPPPVVLVYPPKFAINIQTKDTLRWNPVPVAFNYHLQLTTDSMFLSTIINDSTISGSQPFKFTGQLAGNTKYYWRVSARNSGGKGAWSEIWVFQTVPGAPSVPFLAAPENNTKDLPLNTMLTWLPSTNAERYNVQVAFDTSFINNFVNDTVLSTQRPIGPLTFRTQYFWRVRAINISGASAWSGVRRFGTILPPPVPPVLLAPIMGASNLPTIIKLEWLQDSITKLFHVQVSTDTAFTNLILNDTSITKSNIVIGPLKTGLTYFWRVRSINNTGRSPWSMVWNFMTFEVKISAPITFNPPNGAINIPLEPILIWSSDSLGTNYRLQLSKDSLFTNIVFTDTAIASNYRKVGPLEYNMTYYWRVAVRNKDIISPFSKYSMFKTSAITIATPVLINPPANGINLPTELELRWSYDTLAQYNHLQVSFDSLFVNIIIEDSLLKGNVKQVGPLMFNTSYFWRVKSRNSFGVSLWSPVRKFRTTSPQLFPPNLVSPVNNSGDIPLSVNLRWSGDSLAKFYHLQFSMDPLFGSNIVNDSNIITTSNWIYGLSSSTRYFWRVRSINEAGSSPWSMKFRFSTEFAAPQQIAPLNNQTGVPLNVNLMWRSDSIGSSYHVQVFADTNQAGGLINDPNVKLGEYKIGPLKYGTTYFWRIKSQNSGSASKWSPFWSFTTMQPALPSPALVNPVNFALGVAPTTTFSWSLVDNAINYHIQIAFDSVFKSLQLNDSIIITNSRVVTSLLNGAKYFWRVRAINQNGSSEWSNVNTFVTVLGLPIAPVLTSPFNGSVNRPPVQDLMWAAAPSAIYYRLQISFDQQFNSIALDSFNIVNADAMVGPLSLGKDFFWRVKAFNAIGEGPYSETFKFSTINPPPPLVGLISPENNASGMPLTTVLTWTPTGLQNNYWLQVSIDPNFNNLIIDRFDLSNISYSMSNLSFNTTYFWKVKSVTTNGEAPWSEIRNFTTIYGPPPAPLLNLPSNLATGIDINTNLLWSTTGAVEMYSLELSTDPAFATTIVYEPGYMNNSRYISGLSFGTTYYWRVKSRNMMGESDWVVSQFTTMAAANEGKNWKQPDSTASMLGKINCLFTSTNGFVFAGTDNGVFERSVSTTNWEPFGTNNTELKFVSSIVVNSAGDVFASTRNGIWRIKTGETTWRQMYITFASIVLSITPVGDIVGSFGQTIVISKDNGENWLSLQNLPITDQCQFVSKIFSSDGNIYIGTQWNPNQCTTGTVEIFLSSNQGQSWSSLGFNGRDNAVGISAMCILNTGDLIVGTLGTPQYQGSAYKYFNGTWTKLGLLGDVIPAIAATPGGELFASSLLNTQTGLSFKLYTKNGRSMFNSLLDVKGGISKSKDGGKNWEQVNDGLVDSKVSTINVTPSGQIFLGTADGGVFEGSYTSTNKAPYFTTTLSDTTIYKGQSLTISISADDINKDKLSFSFVNTPAGSRFDSVSNYTRIFKWTPSPNQTGKFSNIQVSVSDGQLTEAGSFNITVSSVNSQPQFVTLLKDTSIKENQTLQFNIEVNDADNDVISFKSSNFPSTAKLDYVSATSRTFNWKPEYGQVGVYRGLTIEISDGALTNSQMFNITVKKDNRPPNPFVLATPVNNTLINLEYPGKVTQFKWNATSDPDLEDVVSYSLFIKGLTLDTAVYGITTTNASVDIMNKLRPNNTYIWYIRATDGILYSVSDTLTFKTSATVTGIVNGGVIPKTYVLEQNYPNPFNPTTTIQFGLPKETDVSIEIYNVLGQKIRTLIYKEHYTAGTWNIIWNGKDDFGRNVSTGMYFFRMVSKEFQVAKKMIMMK